jgi:putative restriction endonuclease
MSLKKATHKDWSRDEHILAFNLYCKIPFGSIHMGNPRIIELARLLGRSIGAVSYKLANISRLDPELKARGIEGLKHGAKGEIEVWNEFYDDPEALAFESERLLANLTGKKLEHVAEIDETELPTEGREREQLVRVRVNQYFFRATVLAAYDYRCCITGLAVPELLVASHIIPWALNAKNRVNPRNGLCLNALHDRAFDRGLMTISSDSKVCFRESVRNMPTSDGLAWLVSYHGRNVVPPQRFKPDPELLAQHRQTHEARSI